MTIQISAKLNWETLEAFDAGREAIVLDEQASTQIVRGEKILRDILESGRTVYGINTGFGLLAEKRISASDLGQLQKNLVLSHACGVGPPLDDRVVRLILLLKIKSLAQGCSGVGLKLVQRLIEMLRRNILPIIPSQGSVGASGDLAPLAHLAAALIGTGEVTIEGKRAQAIDALREASLEPFELGPKEGLALLNGTQVSTALAVAGYLAARNVFAGAVVAGAMSVDAAMGSDTPFDDRIQALRPYAGQRTCAAAYRALLKGSEIRASHVNCSRVQDPYSLRCQPQVMGAVFDQMGYVATQVLCECNSVTDNPLLFPETGECLSGGNFHAEPIALAADALAVCLAEVGSLSERRIALLIDRHLSGLPPFLVENSGLNSGFMIPQVAAAALVSENKCLAHPASVDSLPTSANQEDHVSMATHAARRTIDMAKNTSTVVAIELLAAAQGIDLRKPLRTSPHLQAVHQHIRQQVPPYDRDRFFSPDIQAVLKIVQAGWFRGHCPIDWPN